MTNYGMGARLTRSVAALSVALVMAACSRDTLLEVETPDQITPDQANSPAGAAAIRVAALGNFAAFFGGDYAGSFHGLTITSGLLADEIESARGGTEHVDSRAQNEAVQPLTTTWALVGQAHTQLIRAIAAVDEFAPSGTAGETATKATQLAQLYALRGMLYVLVGESYCNGIPLGNADDLNPATTTYTNAELFEAALTLFDTAASTAGTTAADAPIRNLAAVGRGRALLNLDRHADAATAVAAVPTSFAYNVSYSTTSVVNAVYDWMFGTLNYAPANREGGNGLDFVSANDPRVRVVRDAAGNATLRNGQDGLAHNVQAVFVRGNDPIPLATGVEARLIEAEAALKTGNATTYLAKVNDARASGGVTGLAALADPGSAAARLDQLFRERAFWFWGTAHRVGDLRRLVRQYGRSPETVWPTGPYFKGGSFGTDQNLVPAQTERNNPDYEGCADRNP
jgi:hypothetical protein